MSDDEIIAEIRDAIAVWNFEWDQEHCDYHFGNEGFTIEDVIRTIPTADVIESSPERSRWLFCGRVTRLKQDERFHGQWIHVAIEYDEIIALATAYRPSLHEWRTERIRR